MAKKDRGLPGTGMDRPKGKKIPALQSFKRLTQHGTFAAIKSLNHDKRQNYRQAQQPVNP